MACITRECIEEDENQTCIEPPQCINDESVCLEPSQCVDIDPPDECPTVSCFINVITEQPICKTTTCNIEFIADNICNFICPDGPFECNKAVLLELSDCDSCCSVQWECIEAPAGGNIRFVRHKGARSVLAFASVEGNYVIRACCLD